MEKSKLVYLRRLKMPFAHYAHVVRREGKRYRQKTQRNLPLIKKV